MKEAGEPPVTTVSDVMVETMVNWGIKHVFGMVGHSNLGLADAIIRRRCEAGDLTFIGIRHEGAASFAASAYGKLTGRPAACLSIVGPGATNLLTGLWDARLDQVPILALTGQVDLQFLGPGTFQEVDLAAAFEAAAANFLRVSTEELKKFARLTGNNNVHGLSIDDLCTTNSEISNYTEIKHV